MRKVYFEGSCGVGMTHCDVIEVEDNITEADLDRIAWEIAVACADFYGAYVTEEADLEDAEEESFYDYQLNYWWEWYNPEKHDMFKPGGGSWDD